LGPSILLVEDDPRIATSVASGLAAEGFRVLTASDGRRVAPLAREHAPDLVVLDLMLPGQDGLAALRELRRQAPALPVLILSACDRVEDRVAGLKLGSDDYLVKPFSFAELLARVRALLRRGQPARTSIAVGALKLDLLAQQAHARGARIDLTRREFALLACLARHRGEDVPREMLAREAWHVAHRATPLDNVLEVHVARLRKKLDQAGLPPLIHTVRGIGYRLSRREP